MASRTFDEAVHIAAMWWVNKVIKPTFNNGMNDKQGLFAQSLASYMAEDINKSQAMKFYDFLVEVINEDIEKNGRCTLESDYAPDGSLYEAYNRSETPTANAPWKCWMVISETGEIKFKDGYGSPIESL